MKKPCNNHPKYMYSGKESSPLGLGIAAEPLVLGTVLEGRDKTNWIVTLKNSIKVWSRITRVSDAADKEKNHDEEKPEIKKKPAVVRKKITKKDVDVKGDNIIQDDASAPPPTKINDTQDDNKKDAIATKRKPTNYNIYMKYKLKQLAKENTTMKPKERIAHAVSLWQSMDDITKNNIIETARAALDNGEI